MSEERKKAVWPWTAVLLIALPVLYVASFGPACWLASKTGVAYGEVMPSRGLFVYWPLGWVGYPLSWGPAIFIYVRLHRSAWTAATMHVVYSPLASMLNSGVLPYWIFHPYSRYIEWWSGL